MNLAEMWYEIIKRDAGMRTYDELNQGEKSKVQIAAMNWYRDHKLHVNRLIKDDEKYYPPYGNDLFRPELWKPAHWRWFAVGWLSVSIVDSL